MNNQTFAFAGVFFLQEFLYLSMGILTNGRVTLVELLAGRQREARILGVVEKAILVRLEKLDCV